MTDAVWNVVEGATICAMFGFCLALACVALHLDTRDADAVGRSARRWNKRAR